MGEYERTVATVINSYVAPASAAYFQTGRRRLQRGRSQASPAHHADLGRRAAGRQGRRDPAHLAGLGPGRRSHRLAVARPATRPQEHHRHRHGRHLVRGRPDHQRRAAGRRREDHRPVPLQAAAAGDDVDRLRRRQPRPGRPVQPLHPRGTRERRGRSRVRCATGGEAPSRPSPTPTWCSGSCRPSRFLGGRMPLDRDGALRAVTGLGRADRARARRDGRRHREDQQREGGRAHQAADGRAGIRSARLRGLRLRRRGPAPRLRLRPGTRGQGRRHPAGQRRLHALGLRLLHLRTWCSTSRGSSCSSRPSRSTS